MTLDQKTGSSKLANERRKSSRGRRRPAEMPRHVGGSNGSPGPSEPLDFPSEREQAPPEPEQVQPRELALIQRHCLPEPPCCPQPRPSFGTS
jgi:hypothetical protein